MRQSYSEGKAILIRPGGLHLRPAARLSQLASSFASAISVRTRADEPWIDAKSLVKVIRLKARCNTVLHLKAEGSDARQAVEAIVGFIEHSIDDA